MPKPDRTGDRPPEPSSSTASPAVEDRVSRRGVLRATGAGTLTVVVAGAGLLSYRAYDNRVLGADTGGAFDAWRHWRDAPGAFGAVAAATLAASPHNTQPWTFHLDRDGVEVYADAARRMSSVDPYSREMHLGLGCALENLVLAAQARGLDSRVVLRPDRTRPLLVARVDLRPGPRHGSALYDAIGHRHTNRGPYRNKPVPAVTLAGLGRLATEPAAVPVWITERGARDALGRLLVEAAEAVTADPDQSRDGFAWFRSRADDIETHKDGLTLDVQGMSPLLTSIGKLLPATSRTSGDAFWVKQTRTVHTATAAAYGVILVNDPHDPEQQLIGGRLLQRIHLAVTAAGLALHHMNQITERIDRDRSLGRDPVFAPRLAALVGRPDRQVLATFRLGYPVRPGRRSPRRSMSEVLR